jgi:hypothetical protein
MIIIVTIKFQIAIDNETEMSLNVLPANNCEIAGLLKIGAATRLKIYCWRLSPSHYSKNSVAETSDEALWRADTGVRPYEQMSVIS